jgi:hypothetical protein
VEWAEWFVAPGYEASRWLFVRGAAVIHLLAFVAVVHQWRPLAGERGLTPAPRFLARVDARRAPSLFHRHYSDRFAIGLAWVGIVLSASLVVGLPQRGPVWLYVLVWLVLYGLYLSYVNVGQVWYAFGWETLTLEVAVLAALLGPDHVGVPWPAVLMVRWLVFRVELGAGLIKLRGDQCWRDLTCLEYHHETQPMPNPVSWWAHHLPRWWHRTEVAGNHVVQLLVPFLLFLPQPVAGVAGVAILVTQGWLVISGNFAWLNALTMLLALLAIPSSWLEPVVGAHPVVTDTGPLWWVALVLAAGVATVVLSRAPVRNLASPRQAMNTSFNRWRLVGSYGAFGSITRRRYELVLEWTHHDPRDDDARWHAYHVPGKPTDPSRRPPQVAPYHLRLGWLLWFAAMSPRPRDPWFLELVGRLLDGDALAAQLVRDAPERPPRAVRVRRARYRYATPAERRETGDWWVVTEDRTVLGPSVGAGPPGGD